MKILFKIIVKLFISACIILAVIFIVGVFRFPTTAGINAGDKWIEESNPDPFCGFTPDTVVVLDTKDNYVLYEKNNCQYSLPAEAFRLAYNKLK